MDPADLKERVRTHWEEEPCGSTTSERAPGSPEFFAEVERHRYRAEPFIPGFAQFDRWQGKQILEVGVGLGTDFVNFVRAGAHATGVDLTDAAVDAVRNRLRLEGLEASVLRADAEALPFPDASFDLVYAWGVLHHSPDTTRAVAEVRRVLRHDGEARLMLYSRRSWFAYGGWVRWALLRGRPWLSISKALGSNLESPGTKAYTRRELGELFNVFSTWSAEGFVTPYDRRVVGPIANLTGSRMGFFLGIVARP